MKGKKGMEEGRGKDEHLLPPVLLPSYHLFIFYTGGITALPRKLGEGNRTELISDPALGSGE